jgi:hypothetical protein
MIEKTKEEIIEDIFNELKRAESIHPGWPTDLIHGAVIVGEESGELLQAAFDVYYGNGNLDYVYEEAVQTAAMAIRFLFNLNCMKRER